MSTFNKFLLGCTIIATTAVVTLVGVGIASELDDIRGRELRIRRLKKILCILTIDIRNIFKIIKWANHSKNFVSVVEFLIAYKFWID